jgi:hypothetical protein
MVGGTNVLFCFFKKNRLIKSGRVDVAAHTNCVNLSVNFFQTKKEEGALRQGKEKPNKKWHY